ncbi:MAG: biosynthetic peptidoglycan transglycosylase [Myxococcaceae bacterium]
MLRLLFLTAFLAWFAPWVLVLQLGFVIYRPYEPNGEDRYWRVTGSWFESWTPSAQIPKTCKAALVYQEDRSFYQHYGFDLENIKRALQKNERRGKIRYGASTITQQLVKNLFLSRNKSYLRKVREMTGAVLLDATLSKQDQLAWYFNVVEFGPRIYGIKAAAKAYFGKKPENLNADECRTLVSALPSPVKRYRALTRARL